MNYPYECENCINTRELGYRRQARAIIKGGSLAPNLIIYCLFYLIVKNYEFNTPFKLP